MDMSTRWTLTEYLLSKTTFVKDAWYTAVTVAVDWKVPVCQACGNARVVAVA